MTHTRKSPLQSLAAFAEAVASATGLSPLQPWQKRFLDAIERKRRLDRFADYEPERDGFTAQGLLWPEHTAAERRRLGLPTLETLLRGDLRTRFPAGAPVIYGRSRISDAADAAALAIGIDLGATESTTVTGWRRGGVWTIDRIDRNERRPEEIFVPIGRRDGRPGHGGYFSTPSSAEARTWAEELFARYPVEVELREVPPIWPLDPGRAVRLVATIDTSRLRRELARLSRAIEITRLKMRVRRLDRGPITGAGRLLLEVLIRAEYRKRRAFFGEPWKAAAARYADLQTLHRDLYGVAAEVRR